MLLSLIYFDITTSNLEQVVIVSCNSSRYDRSFRM